MKTKKYMVLLFLFAFVTYTNAQIDVDHKKKENSGVSESAPELMGSVNTENKLQASYYAVKNFIMPVIGLAILLKLISVVVKYITGKEDASSILNWGVALLTCIIIIAFLESNMGLRLIAT
jgi:hypothetical protein